jgi:hypothetical protein
MAETALPIQDINDPFDVPAAGEADFTWTAADNVNGNSIQCTGREIILMRNDNVGAQTVTITSTEDDKGRTEDITAYSLGIGEYAQFGVGLTNSKGWKQPAGTILLTPSAADLMFAILRVPAGGR